MGVLPDQRVVVYDTEDDGGNPKEEVYAAVYSAEQANHYIARCIVRHGGDSKPRVKAT